LRNEEIPSRRNLEEDTSPITTAYILHSWVMGCGGSTANEGSAAATVVAENDDRKAQVPVKAPVKDAAGHTVDADNGGKLKPKRKANKKRHSSDSSSSSSSSSSSGSDSDSDDENGNKDASLKPSALEASANGDHEKSGIASPSTKRSTLIDPMPMGHVSVVDDGKNDSDSDDAQLRAVAKAPSDLSKKPTLTPLGGGKPGKPRRKPKRVVRRGFGVKKPEQPEQP
jgi:hypothetical protein